MCVPGLLFQNSVGTILAGNQAGQNGETNDKSTQFGPILCN